MTNKRGVSDRSREYTRHALNAARSIREKYPRKPEVATLGGEQKTLLNESIRRLGESVRQTNYEGISGFQAFRAIRNELAHSVRDIPDDRLGKIYDTIFDRLDALLAELDANIERSYSGNREIRRFEKFDAGVFREERDRKRFVDGVKDAMNSDVPAAERIAPPDSKYSAATKKLLEPDDRTKKDLLEYASGNDNLRDAVVTDILSWIKKTNETLDGENPFRDEERYVEIVTAKSSSEIQDSIDDIATFYTSIVIDARLLDEGIREPRVPFDFYKKQFSGKKPDTKVLSRNLLKDMDTELIERKLAWELDRIEQSRKAFLEELYGKLDNFRKIERALTPFVDSFGRLWDMSSAPFSDSGFEVLAQYADILSNEQGLRELAELLGRHQKEAASYRKELRDAIKIEYEFSPKEAYKGQISGLRLSNDISSVIPSEIALLKNHATKKLFMLKYAQNQLLSYAYRTETAVRRETSTREYVDVVEEQKKGPYILCVDTSGSMNGTPERIAKTISFALAVKAVEEERKCYLVSFSTGIETLDLSQSSEDTANRAKDNPFARLVGFLRMSFNGGTDANPALMHSIKLIEDNKWERADVLMVSDFVMDDLDKTTVTGIESLGQTGTKFYSLTIGSGANPQTIKCFTENWQYDANSPSSMSKLVRQLHSM